MKQPSRTLWCCWVLLSPTHVPRPLVRELSGAKLRRAIMAARFGPPVTHKSASARAAERNRAGMIPDKAFGAPRSDRHHVSHHKIYAGQDGVNRCSCCSGAHVADKADARRKKSNPKLVGRRMALGHEWRYVESQERVDNGIIRSGMLSSEAPAWMTRIGETVHQHDYGHSHPFATDSHTEHLRDKSVMKGCGKKCSWRSGGVSSDSPFSDDNSSHRPKSAYAQAYSGSRINSAGSSGRKSPRAPVPPPYQRAALQHDNDFGKSKPCSTGKQATSRFYNSIGGWSAARG